MANTSVLITTEGTYPCYPGGVSVWCDYLVRQLDEMDFHVFALTHSPSVRTHFEMPPNVASCTLHSIWGTEEPGAGGQELSQIYQRKIRTTPEQIRDAFIPHFEAVARGLLEPDAGPERLARGLAGIHAYSRRFDYALSIGSQDAWETFLRAASHTNLDLNLDDATNCMRWLQRYLSILAVRFPEVDLVHASIAGLAGIPGVLCKLAYNSGFLLSEHGLHLRELYMMLARCPYSRKCRMFLAQFNRAITRMNYYFADQISSLGEFNRRWQVRLGANPEKLVIVPNGVNPETYRPRPSLVRTRPTVLTMARIMPIKGIEVLIRAAAQVRDKVPDVRLIIFGDTGDPVYQRHCVGLVEEFNLTGNIEFGVTRDSASAYQLADVFCLPSLSEGMPYAIIEAMMSGCPVVASDVGSVADLLGGHGMLVKPNHPEELAAALLPLLTGPGAADLRRALAEPARGRASRSFTISSFSKQFRDIYQDLTNATTTPLLSRAAL